MKLLEKNVTDMLVWCIPGRGGTALPQITHSSVSDQGC